MGEVDVVTGRGAGSGRQLSRRLARGDDRVNATVRGTQGRNAEAAQQLGDLAASESVDLRVLDLDVTSTSSVDAAAATILGESGALDVLVDEVAWSSWAPPRPSTPTRVPRDRPGACRSPGITRREESLG